MDFGTVADAFFSGDAKERSLSTLEYRISDGPRLAAGISGCEIILLIEGTGRVAFRRRGDSGESQDCPPGNWRSTCTPSQLESLWDKLGEISPESYPLRVADPGDPVTYLTAYARGKLHTMAIGPRDLSRPTPGNGFMQTLGPILSNAEAAECVWSIKMRLLEAKPSPSGTIAEIELFNTGLKPIGILLAHPNEAPQFSFRFAQHSEEIPYPEWYRVKGRVGAGMQSNLLQLEPGIPRRLSLDFDCRFPANGKYRGLIGYSQFQVLDRIAGQSILTGNCFTQLAEFVV